MFWGRNMGLCYQEARMLIAACTGGASFRHTLTIGRQELYLHSAEVAALRKASRQPERQEAAEFWSRYRQGDYLDGFCRAALAAESVTALDYSSYEGAEVVHDLNTPVPADWRQRYDAVIDGGSLEHIFHFPTAITNVMEMTKVGGSVFISVPANNHCGHGFYQFSPELMFRVFSPPNGFQTERVALVEAPYPSPELTVNRAVYDVVDPAAVACRVGLLSQGPVMMLVWARRTEAVRPFQKPPLQSDYQAQWQAASAGPATTRSAWRKLISRVYRALPTGIQNHINGRLQRRRFSFANRQCYRRSSG